MTSARNPLDETHPLYSSLLRLVENLSTLLKLCDISLQEFIVLFELAYLDKSAPQSARVHDPEFVPETKELLAAMLSLWHSEARYLDEMADPLPLPLRGANSLETIYQQAAKPFAKIRDQLTFEQSVQRLQHHQSIEKRGNEYVALQPFFTTSNTDVSGAHGGVVYAADMIRTSVLNALASADDAVFQRSANTPRFPAELVPVIQGKLEDQGMTLLKEIDNFIESNKITDPDDPRDAVRIAVNLFLSHTDAEKNTQ